MNTSIGWFLRAFARLFVRGPDAPFILGDMEEGLRRDVARGMSLSRARLRFLVNAVGSGLSLLHSSIRASRLPGQRPAWLDVKLGWRMLRKTPLLTTVAVLSLAIGIPVGMFPAHVLDAMDAAPPVEGGERLMGLRFREAGQGGVASTSYDLAAWQETLRSFEGLAAFRMVERNMAVGGEVGVPMDAAEVTSSAFPLLRVRPFLGRAIQAADEVPGAAPVVVLGHDVWESRFGSAPDVVGATVRLGGVPHTVVGVMPEGFLFPIRHSLWLPLRRATEGEPGQGLPLSVFGRLAERVHPDAAQVELSAMHGRMAAQFPELYGRVDAEVVTLTTLVAGYPKGGISATQGAGPFSFIVIAQALALFLLLVACANVGLLIFARTAARSAELAMRTALGASRGRLVLQVATEAFVLALVAAGIGLLLMATLSGSLVALWSPDGAELPWWIDFGLTPATVARALLLAVLSATAAAVFPALRVTGSAVRRNLQRSGGGAHGMAFGGVWSVLVVADVAAAIAAVGLIIGVGARMAPIASGESIAGLPAHEYLSVQLDLPDPWQVARADTADAAAQRALLAATQRRLMERLEAEPGVQGVTVADRLPRMDHGSGRIEVEGGLVEGVEVASVDPGFFRTLRQPLLAGRDFHQGDVEGDRRTVIVNTAFAEQLLGRSNPVGQRVRYAPWSADEEPGPWLEIVGMVPDLGMDPLQPENAAGIYHPVAPGEIDAPYLAVHVADPAAFAPRLREIAAEVDPTAIVHATPLDDVYPDDWYSAVRLALACSILVAVLLTLVASGIYATMAFSVTQRTREIGIRSALGARTSDVIASIARRAALQLGMGALLGMPLAGFVYFNLRGDPAARLDAFVVAVVPGLIILLVVALTACTVPLLRALRIAPTEAMKA